MRDERDRTEQRGKMHVACMDGRYNRGNDTCFKGVGPRAVGVGYTGSRKKVKKSASLPPHTHRFFGRDLIRRYC
jgi:hypothetical protein